MNIQFRWIEQLNVASALARIAGSVDPLQKCVITAIDSNRDLSSLRGRNWNGVELQGHSVILQANTLFNLNAEQELFTGFDEVWMFAASSRIPNLTGLVLTSEVPIVATASLRHVAACGCFLALGDGIGLNFMTTDAKIFSLLTTNSDLPK